MASAAPMEFWFDFASTYSYVAAMRIERAAAAEGVPLVWKPFLLGPIFKRQGWDDSPFNLNPARGRYMWRDVERLCRAYAIPFRRPSSFPRNSVLAARVACVFESEPWMPWFARAVFKANFEDDLEIADRALVIELLGSSGRSGAELVALAEAPGNRERLRRQTETAWERGIFGAPSFFADDELFWGNDRLEQALEWHRAAARASGSTEPPR